MQASQVPVKFPLTWGQNASGSYIRSVPSASQIAINAGAASFSDGFPPVTFLQDNAGGTPPDGRDVNGGFGMMSAWNQWYQAGGPIYWDAAFSAGIGGYPNGAIVKALSGLGCYWLCEVDNNTSNPDSGGAGWIMFRLYFPSSPVPNLANTAISASTNAGLSLAPVGDQAIQINTPTIVNLQNITVPPAIGTVSGGVMDVAKSGFYFIQAAAAMEVSSQTADVGTFIMRFLLNRSGAISGTPVSGAYPIPMGGGQAVINLNIGFIGQLLAGDLVYLQATIGDQMNTGVNATVSAYTNMSLIYMNQSE